MTLMELIQDWAEKEDYITVLSVNSLGRETLLFMGVTRESKRVDLDFLCKNVMV